MQSIIECDVEQSTRFVDKVLDHAYDSNGEVRWDERKTMIAELATMFQNIRKEETQCQLYPSAEALKSKVLTVADQS